MDAVTERVRAVRTAAGRISLIPLLVRVGVFLTALAGFVLAFPAEVLSGQRLGSLVLVAVLPAVGPRRVWPTFTALVTVGGWLISVDGYGRPITLWRLLAVAGVLYLTHTLCALAALLPYDAVVEPELITRWLVRAAGVLLATAVLGVLLVEVPDLGGGAGYQLATVAGLLVAVGVAGLLGWLQRRR
ncbi:hypothetical protein ACFOOK_25955 [Micromonospora krabiensis]|uniref:hypothetical protein n=1 Tax=Micromonospora krabiensis TaxID=307121 RepID=UPI003605CC10